MSAAGGNTRVGTRFGPYRLDALLGKGGMGEVYQAYDTVKDRTVAIKLLPEHLAKDPVYQERFRRESRAAARLQEPHVIPIHDFGEINGVLFIDMRLVTGEDLRAVLKSSHSLSPARSVAIVSEIASALDAAHADGMVHRDVKPENILITTGDFAYLVDFGIAATSSEAKLTQVGSAIGSMAYMAPERFDNTPVTKASDIYALACVLYECLTGSTPFPAPSVSALVNAHLHVPPPRPSAQHRNIPSGLDVVIARGLAKQPGDRYRTAGELARAAHDALAAPDQAAASTILARAQAETLLNNPAPQQPPPTAGFPPGQQGPFAPSPQYPSPQYPGPPYPPGGSTRPGMPPSGQAYPAPPQPAPSYRPPGFPAGQFDPYAPAPRAKSPLVPILVTVLVVVVLAVAGVLAWAAYSSSQRDSPTPGTTQAGSTPGGGSTGGEPGTGTTTEEGPVRLPANAAPCPAVFGDLNGYNSSAIGTDVTSCPFAEEVRFAYARGGDRGEDRSVEAVSPVTEQAYTMYCTADGGLVTCRGGNNAVVYVY